MHGLKSFLSSWDTHLKFANLLANK
uniref:Uncharacterized protein n=1 Tax=Acrobeloides nanus TaxID=290746 RepID=A0A914DGQ6_9BILA